MGLGVFILSAETQARTRTSLILRLKEQPQDQSAWSEFVRRYEPRLQDWCRHWQLQEADAQDVTQAVLMQLLTKLQNFEYDPAKSFRSWLKTLAQRAWHDMIVRRRQLRTNLGAGEEDDPFATLAAQEDLSVRLQEAFDLELLELAMANVRARVAANTWEAYRLTAIENLAGAAVAARLAMPVMNVFKARSNVQKMLQDEIERLEEKPLP